jgi:hypothetical protein
MGRVNPRLVSPGNIYFLIDHCMILGSSLQNAISLLLLEEKATIPSLPHLIMPPPALLVPNTPLPPALPFKKY